jgi:hypothetical protein
LFVDQNIFVAVTKQKLFGRTYAFLVDLALGGSSLTTVRFGAVATGAALGDTYIAPLVLGWNFTRWDLEATGGFTAPPGGFTRAPPTTLEWDTGGSCQPSARPYI